MAGAASKRLLQPGVLRRFELWRLPVPSQRQHAMRRENRHQHRRILRIDVMFLSAATPINRRSIVVSSLWIFLAAARGPHGCDETSSHAFAIDEIWVARPSASAPSWRPILADDRAFRSARARLLVG
jgi:hypothetical protein